MSNNEFELSFDEDEDSLEDILSELQSESLREYKGIIAKTDETGRAYQIGKIKYSTENEYVYYSINENGYLGIDNEACDFDKNDTLNDDLKDYEFFDSDSTNEELIGKFNAPQGYLAKILSERHGLADPTRWRREDVIRALFFAGENLSGGLMYFKSVDEMNHWQFKELDSSVTYNKNCKDEAKIISEICDTYKSSKTAKGSNVGGAKAKSLVNVVNEDGTWYSAIIKYPEKTDLNYEETNRQLAFEHAALKTLDKFGIRVAKTRLIQDTSGRNFLEVKREDRSIALSVKDKPVSTHWVSAQSWLSLHGGSDKSDIIIRDKLYQNLIEAKDPNAKKEAQKELYTFSSVLAYSALIGNTDMHLGNLSLVKEDEENGSFAYKISHYYDIEPYFLRSGETLPDYLHDKKLSEINQPNQLPYQNGSISQNVFENGLKLRNQFIKEVMQLYKEKMITKSDYNIFWSEFSECIYDFDKKNNNEFSQK